MTNFKTLGYGHNGFEINEQEQEEIFSCLGHNSFIEQEPDNRISRSLLSLAYKEDKEKMVFGIVDSGTGKRPVIFICGEYRYIDLISGHIIEEVGFEEDEIATVSYYCGTFTFKGNKGNTAFIDKELLVKNYGWSIIKD